MHAALLSPPLPHQPWLTPRLSLAPPAFRPAAAQVSLGPGVAEGRPLSVTEKLELCCATERARIAFGRSGIHGWGLFARVPMPQDSMVAEFRCAAPAAPAAPAALRLLLCAVLWLPFCPGCAPARLPAPTTSLLPLLTLRPAPRS